MMLDVAFIEPERELINVAVQMLRADMVERAVNAALKNGKDAFDAVCRHVVADELGCAVVDRFMGEAGEATIGRKFIGMDRRAGFDMLADFIVDYVVVGCLDWHGARAPAPLAHSEDGRLADRAAPGVQLLVRVLVGFFPADIGFVNLDDSAQLFELVAASLAEPPENEPSGFLCDADFLASCMDEMPLRAVTTRYIA